ncbi:MAG: glycosyltransferase family 9 protein [Bacteroidetes bacterium]|nr:glycosyltransferase family 9 protein [Bacteroidota bacterium]
MRKILVIQTASIGDVILTTPLLEKLRYLYPDAEIDFLLKKGNESLFNSHPYLHYIYIWNKETNKYGNLLQILKTIRNKKYDLVVNVQRFATSGIITAFSKAKTTVGFDKNPFSVFFSKRIKHKIGKGIHEVERNMELLAFLPSNRKFDVRLYPSDENFASVAQYKSHIYICIAPASLWETKQFPKNKWIEFIKSLDGELSIYLLGSKNDIALCEDIISASNSKNIVSLSGKLSMLESAALMKNALMNYVNDSSPLHLASATNAKVTAVFCSTVAEFGFGPLSDDAVVIEVKEKLACRPCGLHGYHKCPEKHFKCALDIDVQLLKNRIKSE